jgi:hypothetical protein
MEAEFGRVLKGYWPPAGLFTRDMVPTLVQAGYEYVLLPNRVLVTPEGRQADPYRSYRLCYQDACITVVSYEQGFSRAQESGLEAPWFADEVRNSVAQAPAADAPYLLTTWSDGENGEWFRRPDEEHGFFGQFFSPYMEFCETGEFPVRPVNLSDYLRAYPPETDIDLKAQALTGQMPGSAGGNEGLLGRLSRVAAHYWSLAKAAPGGSGPSREDLLLARELILCAEDSCYLLGGDTSRQAMLELLEKAEGLLNESPPNKTPLVVKTPKPPVKAQAVAAAPEPPEKRKATSHTPRKGRAPKKKSRKRRP